MRLRLLHLCFGQEVGHRLTLAALSSVIFGLLRLILPEKWGAGQYADFWHFYYPLAQNVLSGKGYCLGDAVCTQYPPGYPLFLAGILAVTRGVGLSDGTALVLLVWIFGVAIPQAAYTLGKQVTNQRIAFFGALALLLYPPYLWLTKQPNSELPFSLLLITAVSVLVRTVGDPAVKFRSATLIGVLAGVMTLFRPIAILIGPCLAILLTLLTTKWRTSTKISFLLVLLAANVATVVPWSIYASVRKNKLVIVSTSGLAAMLDGLTYYHQASPTPERSFAPEGARRLMKDIYERRAEVKRFGDLTAILGTAIKEHPLAVLQLFALKALRVWYGTDSQWLEKELILVQLPFLAGFVFGLFLLWKGATPQHSYIVLASGVVLYTWAMAVAALSIARYMTPAVTLAVPAWGMTAATLWQWLTPRWQRRHRTQNMGS